VHHPCAWARRVALRGWLKQRLPREVPMADLPERACPPDSGLDQWEQQHEVLRALGALPHRQRQVLTCQLFGFTPSETAIELGIRADAVRGNLAKARQALREQLRSREEQDD
jgi:RNA polymerase sigma factor (sigma-70 family)